MPTLICPICRREVDYRSRDEVPRHPFCSQRCQQIDLGRWLNEEYRVTEDGIEHVRPDDASEEPEDAAGPDRA